MRADSRRLAGVPCTGLHGVRFYRGAGSKDDSGFNATKDRIEESYTNRGMAASAVVVGSRYRVMRSGAALREGASPASPRVGTLLIGEEVDVLATEETPDGFTQIGTARGWVGLTTSGLSAAASGTVLALVDDSGGAANGAGGAPFAAAGDSVDDSVLHTRPRGQSWGAGPQIVTRPRGQSWGIAGQPAPAAAAEGDDDESSAAELRQLALEAEELLGPASSERLSEARAEAARETPSPRSPVAAQLAELQREAESLTSPHSEEGEPPARQPAEDETPERAQIQRKRAALEELEALEARVSQQLGSVLESSMGLEEWLAQFSLESYAEPMKALG